MRLPMHLSYSVLLWLAVLTTIVNGQDTNETTSDGAAVPIWSLTTKIQAGSSNICNKTFADTNATGIFYINPDVLQGPQAGQPENTSGKTQRSGLAVTIHNVAKSTNSSDTTSSDYGLWYSPNGANYSDDYTLGYDVCALLGFSVNYNTQLRGQDDDGTCSSTLDDPCINDLKSVAEQYAGWLTTPNTFGAGSNLTNTTLPSVCNALGASVRDNFPANCSYFFQDSAVDGLGWPLTSYGDSFDTVLNPNCTLNGTWQNAVSLYNNNSRSIYTSWAHSVTPVLFIFMPVADSGATTRISSPVAELTCLHMTEFNEDSYVPPAAPDPTAVAYNATTSPEEANYDDGLSGGAIAGIAVGCVAFVAIVAAIWFAYTRRQKKKKATAAAAAAASGEQDLDGKTGVLQKSELPGENSRFEAGGPDPRELEGHDSRHQLEGDEARHQLHGDEARHQLHGDDTRFQLPATREEGGIDNAQLLDGKEGTREPVELPAS